MNRIGLATILVALALSVSADASAKGRIRSSHTHHSADTHVSESGSGIVRNAVARSGRSNDNSATGDNPSFGNSATSEEDENLRRIRQEKEAARAKRDAAILEARKLQQAADEEKRKEQAEQAAIAAADEKKRREAEAKVKNRELALLERQKRQVAWEARCDIKPVMSDEEIAICKEVRSKPAP
ncbi:MAG: hypothetical protein H6R16_3188 [Proteobacteria bacterium]|nr:hypothetical protein [Pseudomonadota bacterium]